MRIRSILLLRFLALLIAAFGNVSAQGSQAGRTPDVPFVPTTEAAVQGMLRLADVRSTDIVYDLGCGDGRIVITAAKVYDAHGVGIDIDPQRIQEAKENAKKAGVENLVRFEENDLFKADIRSATVVTLFLLSSINQRLRPRLQNELRPGTRIVSNTFDMGDWKPDKEITAETEPPESYLSRQLYLWIIGKRR